VATCTSAQRKPPRPSLDDAHVPPHFPVVVLRQVARAGLVASAFLLFWIGAVILAWTVCPVLMIVHRDRTRRWRVCQRIVRPWLRFFHAYMSGLTLVQNELATGASRDRPVGVFVMVANHPTLVDATAILADYEGLCVVVRSSLLRNFFVGRVFRCSGHIDGGVGGPFSSVAVLRAAEDRLARGLSVLIFPEGTRSPPGGMHRLQSGAFELARRAEVPLWPMFMTCSPPALSKGLPIWKHPRDVARLRLHPDPWFRVSGGRDQSRASCDRIEAAFRERIGARTSSGAGAA
jgi:1-acyl-sn-glycerol-3-phosphate acyltransferase